jgi:DNA polymerase-1
MHEPRLTLLLDTYSLFYRAHYALPPMSTKSGEPTSALYGLSVLLIKLLYEQRPSALAFALDAGPSFRRELYDGYKAKRARMPDDLRRQRARLDDLIAAFGVPHHAAPGFEGDDVLATLARRIEGDVVIVSGDRDLFQTIDARTRVLFVGRRGQDHVMYDEAAVHARFGISPSQLPSFTALVGDDADELPGIPGVGAKTASKWIAAYGDTTALLANIDTLAPARLREVVRANADQITLVEQLARLRADAPIEPPLAGPIDDAARARVREMFGALEFRSLIARWDQQPS